MTAITLNVATPLDLSDDSRLLFTNDSAETLSRAVDNTPGGFSNMNSLSWQVEYLVNGRADDTYGLGIRIVNGATILAADDAGGTFSTVNANVTNATDTTSAVTAFAYVNTGANQTDWDGASVELQQSYSKSKGSDAGHIEVDFVELTGDYAAGATTYTKTLTASGTLQAALEKTNTLRGALQKADTLTHTVRGTLAINTLLTPVARGVLLANLSKQPILSGALQGSDLRSLTASGTLAYSFMKNPSVRGTLQAVQMPTISAKGLLLQELAKTSALVGALQISDDRASTIRGILGIVGTEVTALKGTLSRSVALTLSVRGNLTDPVAEGFTISAGLVGLLTETYNPTLVMRGALGIQDTLSTTASGVLGVDGLETSTIRGTLQEVLSHTAAMVGLLGVKATAISYLTAGLAVVQTQTTALKGALKKSLTPNLGVSGNFQNPFTTYAGTTSLGGALAKIGSISAAASGTLLKQKTLASSISGALGSQTVLKVPTALDIVVYDTFLPTVDISGTLLQEQVKALTVRAALMQVNTADMSITGRLVYRYFLTPTVTGVLLLQGLKTLGINAYLKHVIACYVEPQGGEKSTTYSTETGKSSAWGSEGSSTPGWTKEEVAPNGC